MSAIASTSSSSFPRSLQTCTRSLERGEKESQGCRCTSTSFFPTERSAKDCTAGCSRRWSQPYDWSCDSIARFATCQRRPPCPFNASRRHLALRGIGRLSSVRHLSSASFGGSSRLCHVSGDLFSDVSRLQQMDAHEPWGNAESKQRIGLATPGGGDMQCGSARDGTSAAAISTSEEDVANGATLADCALLEFSSVADRLADEAGKIVSRFFRSPLMIENKIDMSPVTVADRMAEEAMRKIISSTYPSHGIFGEEHGLSLGSGNGEFVWVLDPIDGTKSFITGKPLFGTLISLLHNGIPVLGVIDQVVLKERWVGLLGLRTTLNGEVITTRKCSRLSEAYMYSTTPHMFAGNAEKAFHRIRDEVQTPLYGCDCYAYGLLAAGFVDLVVEADMKPYDYMALVPVIKGAGGIITDWEGNDFQWSANSLPASKAPGEVLAAGDPTLHAEALKVLAWRRSPDV